MTLVQFYKRLCQTLKARRKRIPSLPEVVTILRRSKELLCPYSLKTHTNPWFFGPGYSSSGESHLDDPVLYFDNASGYIKIAPVMLAIQDKEFSKRTPNYIPPRNSYTSFWAKALIEHWPKTNIDDYLEMCSVILCYLAIEFLAEKDNDKVNQYTFFSLYTGPPGIKQLFSISIPLRRVLFASDIL